jgi:sulfite reductase beta subunit-like hemoprotein
MAPVPQTEAPPWETVLKRNSVERLKRELFPLDLPQQWNRLVETPYEALPETDVVRLQWFGLYHDKPKLGSFMMRVKIPGGLLRPAGLRLMGELSREYGRDQGELTTRQNIQLHYIGLEHFPKIADRLRAEGLTTLGACGDAVRNVTGCPVAGIDRRELFDATDLVAEVARFFSGNREYSDLPRKHKITISTCPTGCNAPEINCIAMVGTALEGADGFAVRVGGGQSSTPRLARHLGVFVPREHTLEVLRAIVDVWRLSTRYRISRVKARLKFMIDDYGVIEFRRLVEERLGRKLPDLAEPPMLDGDNDHIGVYAQKQDGLHYAGFPVKLGFMSGSQMIGLADLASEIGGDVRLTRRQNFILTAIPTRRLDEIIGRVGELGFPLESGGAYAASIGCIGDPHCNYAVTPTKPKLESILERLAREFGPAASGLAINLDGCPHACGHHWTGDIGLQGTTGRGPRGEPIEAYDIILRGGLGRNAAIGKPLLRRVPSGLVEDAVSRLAGAYFDGREASESFQDFCVRHSDDELIAIGRGAGPNVA